MSRRRKQARPRSCKRTGDDGGATFDTSDEDETQNSELLGSTDSKSLDGANTSRMSANSSPASPLAVEEADEAGEYTCEMCSASFQNLSQFMNHRNFDCLGEHQGIDLPCDTDISEPSGSMTPSSSCSLEHGQSPSRLSESPASPSIENVSADQLPYTMGVSETNPYGCQHCDKAFSRLSFLKLHEQEHGELMPFRCNYCSRLFRHKRSRDRHVKLHTGDKKYKCSQCDAAFARSDHLKSHLRTHDTGKPFRCAVCNRGYTSAAALSSHMYTHQKSAADSEREYRCQQCEEMFATPKDLQVHCSELHAIEQPKQKILHCNYCSEMFISQDILDAHVEYEHITDQKSNFAMKKVSIFDSKHLYKCIMSQDANSMEMDTAGTEDSTVLTSVNNQEKITDSSSVDQQSGECLVCPYCLRDNFESLELLEIHMQCVHSVKATDVYTCNYCNAPYPNLYALHDHMKVVHQNLSCVDIKYPCSLCSRQFTSIDALAEHKKQSHTPGTSSDQSVESLYCPECALYFACPSELQEHIYNSHSCSMESSHPKQKSKKVSLANDSKKDLKKLEYFHNKDTGMPAEGKKEKITCDQCNAVFHDIKTFQVHLKIHLDSVLPKYLCPQCSKQFSTEDQLESHLSLHYLCMTTEYGCTSCMKTFCKPDELQKHLMDIHAHHLYRCSLCKEIFDSKVNIQVHFAIKHSNECKIYKCMKCNSVFLSEVEWQLHVRSAHLQMTKPYKCLFCKEGFGTEVELQCHLTMHGKPFKCPMCSEAFHVEYLLDKHLQNEHNPGEKASTPLISSIKLEKDAAGSNCLTVESTMIQSTSGIWKSTDPLHTCNICDMKFSHVSALQIHKKTDHRIIAARASQSPPTDRTPNRTTVNEKISLACTFCSQTFKSKSELDRHMRIHLNSNSQKCNICDEVFPSPNTLAEHKLQHCKIPQGNTCVGCKLPLKTEDQFYIHSQEHGFQGAMMQCIICRQTLASMMELQMHGKHHFQTKPNFFTCCVCLRSFDSKENLISKLNSSSRTYYVCKPCYHGEMAEFACPECGSRFPTNEQLEVHVATHRRTYQCIKCQQSFSTEYQIQLHVATHVLQEGNVHECKLCSQILDSPAKLQCHLIDHTYENSELRCSICCKVFNSSSEIQAHALEHGLHSRKFGCSQCSQRFFFSAELDNHMMCHKQQLHSEFQCKDCYKSFTSVSSFNSHRKLHKEAKPTVKCSLCFDIFSNVSELQQHFLIHHSDVDSDSKLKAFSCTLCDKVFPSISNLQSHIKTHKAGVKYSCPICQKMFSLSRNLSTHLQTHDGEKPHECPICKKRFARKENRKAHLKCHASMRPYVCSICGKTFSKKGHVNEHMKAHLPKETTSFTDQTSIAADTNGENLSCTSEDTNGVIDSSPASEAETRTKKDGNCSESDTETFIKQEESISFISF